MAGDVGFEMEVPDLRSLLADMKAFDPKLATGLRKGLRAVGGVVIAEQRAALAGPKPGKIRKTGSRLRTIKSKDGRKTYKALRNVYDEGSDGGEASSRKLRDVIGAGLRVSIVAGKSRQGVQIKTTGPNVGGANMARVYQAKTFRHPVFADASKSSSRWVWVYQRGVPYFWDPVNNNWKSISVEMLKVLDDAMATLAE